MDSKSEKHETLGRLQNRVFRRMLRFSWTENVMNENASEDLQGEENLLSGTYLLRKKIQSSKVDTGG